MPDPLSLIPSGSQYDTLRWTLRHLRSLDEAGHGTNYAGLVSQPDRIRGWVEEIDSGSGRDADQIRDDIVRHIIGPDLARQAYGISAAEFEQLVLGGNEGGLNLGSLTINRQPSDPSTPDSPSAPDQPDQPDPDPDPDTDPEPDPIDYKKRVQTLYPYLPDPLVQIFVDEWAETGNRELAQAAMRASDAYNTYFPGNRRDDGTLRHTEAEYFSIKDAYRTIYREYGLNPSLFEDRFTELIVNDQSPAEHARKLGAAYEGLINNIPEVRQIYAQHGNIELSDQAIFASVIDPKIGEAIINRRISVAQVAGEGAARDFDISQEFAGDLVSGGLDQMAARTLFSDAQGQLNTIDTLVRRHHDPDDDFDIEEFADANVFGDAVQNRRIQRALRAEAASFTPQVGSIATSEDLQVSGLSAR